MLTKIMKVLNKEKEFPGYYISPEIKSMLDRSKYLVQNKDWDRVFLIDGEEGVGKSLLGLQIGYYLDPTLNLDRIVFTGNDFAEAINKAEKNQCIIFDEAFNGLASSGALSQMNKFLVRKLMECRQKNLYIIIVLPTIFLLQKYAAIFRSKALFHVYATKNGDRGFYRVYNKKNKKLLYILGMKLYSYSSPFINKSHIFRGKYPINETEYRKKKHESLENDEQKKEKVNKYAMRFAILANYLKNHLKITYNEQERLLREHGFPLDNAHIAEKVRELPRNHLSQVA